MTTKVKSRKTHFATGIGVANGTYYLDPGGLGTPVTNGVGLSSVVGDSFYGLSGRAIIIKSLHVAATVSGAAPTITLENYAAATIIDRKTSAQYADGSYIYGPEGIRVEGGVEIVLAGAATFSWCLTYEVA